MTIPASRLKYILVRYIAAALLAYSVSTHAAEIRPIFYTALEFGGDTLLTATYTNGWSLPLDAGTGISLAGGFAMPLSDDEDLEAQVTIGVKYNTIIPVSNGSAYMIRYPLEAMLVYYLTDSFRVAGGISYHFSPTLNAIGVLAPAATGFDDALGFVLDIGWAPEFERAYFLRYTNISYRASGSGAVSSGNSIGLIIGFSM